MNAITVVVAILSILVIASGIAVVTLRNLFHCGLALGLCFTGVAGLYFTLSAPFLGAAQILIYVGAITVLILFAIMLTQQVMGGPRSVHASRSGWGLLVVVALWGFLITRVPSASWPIHPDPAPLNGADGTRFLGRQLLTTYLLPFEAASLLLLAAMAGAIVIARDEKGSGRNGDSVDLSDAGQDSPDGNGDEDSYDRRDGVTAEVRDDSREEVVG